MFLGISPGSYNKLNVYNSKKETLCNTQACLRNPCIETSYGGQTGQARKEERGSEELWAIGQSLGPTAVSGEGRIQDTGSLPVAHNPA